MSTDDTIRRDAIARSLCTRLCDERRSIDELRVIDWVLEGLELGAESYGPLDIASDVRNFRRERAMEARDMLFYSAAQAIAERAAREAEIEREFEEAMRSPAFDLSDTLGGES